MESSLTDTLCTRCGLCCDGSLFADVELTGPAEATRLEILGAEIDDDAAGEALLVLPCAALKGTRCSIYAHRPRSCRTFECHLLQATRRGTVSVEQALDHITDALARIARVKALLAELGQGARRLPLKERCEEALAGRSPANPEAIRKHAELAAAMAAVTALIRRRFLGEGPGS